MMIGFVSIFFRFMCLDIYVWVSVQFCLGLPGVLLPCKKRKKSAQMYVSMLTWSILDLTLPFTSVYSYHELFCYSFLTIIRKEKIIIDNIAIE